MAAEVDASVGIVVDATSYYAGRTTSAVCYSVLQYAAVCCIVMQYVAVCCIVMQCVAVCCSVLQCVAVCCSDASVGIVVDATSYYTGRTTSAVCCSMLQCAVM